MSWTSRVRLLAVALASLLPLAPAACIFDDGGAEGSGSTRDTGPTGSTGGTFVLVPDVVGMEVAQAEARLLVAGLNLATVSERPSKLRRDTVLNQTPRPGREVEEGSDVSLVVAEPGQLLVIPDVERLKVKMAKSLLVWRGFFPEVVGREHSASVPKGKVVSQLPAANTEARPGRVVNLVISKGPSQSSGGG